MVEQGGGSIQPLQFLKSTTFEGYEWRSSLREKLFQEIRKEFCILSSVVMEVLEVECCDDMGFVGKVVIPVVLLSHGLRLSFCCPL